VRHFYAAYVTYWGAVLVASAFAVAGRPLLSPEAVASPPPDYLDRLASAAVDVALVAALSYPALFFLAAGYGVLTPAVAGAHGLLYALLFAGVVHVVLFFYAQLAKYHPLARRLAGGRVEWGKYLLWLALSLSLVGVLAL